jgi:hypothetical protein
MKAVQKPRLLLQAVLVSVLVACWRRRTRALDQKSRRDAGGG